MSNVDNIVDCAVCLDDYVGDPSEIMIGQLVRCHHFFHFDCLWEWLDTQPTCPICRKDVELYEEDLKAVCYSNILTNHSSANYIHSEPLSNVSGDRLTLASEQTVQNILDNTEKDGTDENMNAINDRNNRVFHTNTSFHVSTVREVRSQRSNNLTPVDY